MLVVAACGGAHLEAPAPDGKDDGAGRVIAFQRLEDEVLRDLATLDRRFATRARIEPLEEDSRRVNLSALLAEDASLAVVEGAIDPFSFEARARGLASVNAKLAAGPRDLPASAPGLVLAPAFERELLARLVEEETVRLEEERALPRSASALVRAVVDTWSAPTSPARAAERDRWLARRIVEVRNSVGRGSSPLDVVRARELDDALDALEHAIDASGLVQAEGELVKLREVLEAQATRPAAGAQSEWNHVERRVRAHLGFALAPEVLEARLVSLEKTLRAAASRTLGAGGAGGAQPSMAAPLVFADGGNGRRAGEASAPCALAIPGSRVRSMAPPPERAAACRLRQVAASAADDRARALAIVAMHDHVVVAMWALEVARGKATLAVATGKHRPMSAPGPDVIARWERLAVTRPATAIGGGLAAGILYGSGDVEARARAWSELGEVPLDVAERELREGKAADGGKGVSAETKAARP